jgi:hypothetical protein
MIALAIVKSNTVKGWLGEKITSAGMWARLDRADYRRIDDLILPASNGTTQIDHVVVSRYGIFVIETKNIRGWIFGDADGDRWTQSIYGVKHQFQNPLKQNYRHTRCLADFLKVDHDLINSVVFFIGDCEFKTSMPRNVLNSGLTSYIKEFTLSRFTSEQVREIENSLLSLKQDKTLNRQAHLTSLSERHESGTACPKCGGQLVNRVAKQGSVIGKSFLGCSRYPRCRYIKNG